MKCKDYEELGQALHDGFVDGYNEASLKLQLKSDTVWGRAVELPSYKGWCNLPIREILYHGKSVQALMIDDLRKLSKDLNIPIYVNWNIDGSGNITYPNITYTEKEKNKMDAKKCDRCGKLYEMDEYSEGTVSAFFKHEKVGSYEKETYSEFHNHETRVHKMRIMRVASCAVDLCPACSESFKSWFEMSSDRVVMTDSPVRPLKKEE